MSELPDSSVLADLLQDQARNRAAATALVFGDRITGYAALDRRANQVANGLAALGISAQGRVGYIGKNSDAFFELVFGAAKANIVLVPVNWRLAPPEIAAILADAGITLLFVGRGFGAVPAALDMGQPLRCVSIDGASEVWPDFGAWRDGQSATDPAARAAPADTAMQLYTSGTTGLPKGVELTNRNVVAMLAAIRQGGSGSLGPDDVALVCMPVFHIAGAIAGLIGLAQGAVTVILEEPNPALLIECIPRHRVTWLILVPAAILMLVQHPDAAAADFGSVRTLAYGASPIAQALVEQARALFGNAGLWQLYGLTEATGGGAMLPPEAHDPGLGKLRSCGRPYPGFELRIVDLRGEPVPAGTVGEIVLRSPTVMKGYWNNPAATRAAFFEGGWLRTGDAAYMDEDGFVYVHDRVKDMIVTGAENVYPAEVENALYGHPAIADVAVIGVPDPRWGEAVKAVVVLRAGQSAAADEIIAYARQRIAGFKLPKSIDFVTELPRNSSGKVLRRALRAPHWAGRERQVG